jgi:hypothetical protein
MLCIAVLFLAALPAGSEPEPQGKVEGVVVDITDARISNATLTFENEDYEYRIQTRWDGAYSIGLKPGTYAMSVSSMGFCTFRRAAFVLEKHSTVQFNFQMWVCPSDMEFIHYTELEEVPHTHIKPLILFAKSEPEGDLRRFSGFPPTSDGTGHLRKYPAVFSFNLLTVQAEELVYNPTNHMLTALGNVVWQAGSDSGTGTKLEIKLNGLKPKPNP